MNITTATPVEIDTELARIYGQYSRISGQREQALKTIQYYTTGRGARDLNASSSIAQYQAKADKLALQLDALNDEEEPYANEYTRRGGWNRAFLVNNTNGHVHRSMHCSTCFPSTDYCWMVNYSGHDEAEIVVDAGERACTVCYPSAPVETLSRPTKMFTPTEVEAQARREELAAKRSAKDAAKVMDPKTGKELFKTVRGATNQLASNIDSLLWYGESHPSANEWITESKTILIALEVRGDIESADAEWEARLDKARKAYPAKARKAHKEALAMYGAKFVTELNETPKY